ncbi:hypothetical protein IG631_01825 [Alternaria alternata]|nr:hypothetical protein IG631_01825 [Alternaria alternata]
MKAWTTTRSAKRNTAAKSSHTKVALAASLLTPTTRPTIGSRSCPSQYDFATMMRIAKRHRSWRSVAPRSLTPVAHPLWSLVTSDSRPRHSVVQTAMASWAAL